MLHVLKYRYCTRVWPFMSILIPSWKTRIPTVLWYYCVLEYTCTGIQYCAIACYGPYCNMAYSSSMLLEYEYTCTRVPKCTYGHTRVGTRVVHVYRTRVHVVYKHRYWKHHMAIHHVCVYYVLALERSDSRSAPKETFAKCNCLYAVLPVPVVLSTHGSWYAISIAIRVAASTNTVCGFAIVVASGLSQRHGYCTATRSFTNLFDIHLAVDWRLVCATSIHHSTAFSHK